MLDANSLTDLGHHWKVTFTSPVLAGSHANPKATYNKTMMVDVLATTIDSCVAKVREMFPESTIYTVSHHGKIQIDARPLPSN